MSSKNTPNTLIIYIKTRIPNYYKITYDPSMTVPKTKSHTVYFDPLVKYYASIVKNPPIGAPPDTKFTQFFEAKEFETMINRTLSDFRYMQTKRTLNDATNEQIIDNNIKITLETLFASNNTFFLKDIPYTIVGYKWKTGHWNVDIKPIDKLINPYLPISGQEITNAQKELDDIPQENRQGVAVAATLAANEASNNVALGLGVGVETKNIPVKKDETVPLLENTNVVKNMVSGLKNLYGKYLQKNTAVNLDNTKDFVIDPLSLTLLINNTQLQEYFDTKTEASNKALQMYNNYLHTKLLLGQSEKKFSDMVAEIGVFKQEFNAFLNSLPLFSSNDNTFKDKITKVNEFKVTYMTKLFNLYQLLIDIFNTQKAYFASLVFLLEEIKKDYAKIYTYYKKPEMTIKCIDLDIATLSAFINLDANNNNSVSYFDNIKRANNVLGVFQSYENDVANKAIDYDNEFKHIESNPKSLEIQRNQYEVYLLRCILLYHYNQLDIWKNYYDSIVPFINEISAYTSSILIETNDKIINYIITYDQKTRESFLEFYKIEGIRLFVDKFKRKKWRLVNDLGEKAIKKNKNIIKLTNKDFQMEKQYIDLVKSEIECYDLVMLYTYLLEVQCLRQGKVYTAEENVYQIEYEACTLLKNYFNAIKQGIEKSNKKGITSDVYIPTSLMWDTSNFDSVNFINSKIQTNYASMTLYSNKISDIHKSFLDITKYCEELHKSLSPMNEKNMKEQCNILISKTITSMPQYKTQSTYWIKKEIKNYDVRNSIDLNYNISEIINNCYNQGIIDNNKPEYYQDWAVYDNEGGGDCFFASVRDALNGQLDLLNATTINSHTENVDGKKRFTIASLRRIVAFNFTQDDYDFYRAMLGERNENDEYEVSDELTRMAYNLLVEDYPEPPKKKEETSIKFEPSFKFDKAADALSTLGNLAVGLTNLIGGVPRVLIRSYDEAQEIILRPCIYWADEMAIKYIQNTLKIVFIIFNMVPRNEGTFMNGDSVVHKTTGKKYIITKINYKNNKQVFILQDRNGEKLNEVAPEDIDMQNENIMSRFRIECPVFELTFEPKHYIFIAKTSVDDGGGNTSLHYELIRNTGIGMFVYEFSQIPEYIKYFMYENCYKYLQPDVRRTIGFSVIKEFGDLFDNFDKQTIRQTIDLEDPLFVEHDAIYKKLAETKAALDNLKSIEQPDDTIKKDIDNTEKEIELLQEQVNKINEELISKFGKTGSSGGAAQDTTRPSEKYYEYSAPSRGYINKPYFNRGFFSIPPMLYNKVPYEDYINKMKDQSSKTAYYINVDLELYPGKTITTGQKLDTKCQSAFENIREAYADMFGYQYRPAQVTQAYAYETKVRKQLEKEKEKEIQKKILSSKIRGGLKSKTKKRKT